MSNPPELPVVDRRDNRRSRALWTRAEPYWKWRGKGLNAPSALIEAEAGVTITPAYVWVVADVVLPAPVAEEGIFPTSSVGIYNRSFQVELDSSPSFPQLVATLPDGYQPASEINTFGCQISVSGDIYLTSSVGHIDLNRYRIPGLWPQPGSWYSG